jgi:hypothetical protein
MIKLTPITQDAVNWALDGMDIHWDVEGGEGIEDLRFEGKTIRAVFTLPRVEGNQLILSDWWPVNDDLAFRIGQLLVTIISANVLGSNEPRTLVSSSYVLTQRHIDRYKALEAEIRSIIGKEEQ